MSTWSGIGTSRVAKHREVRLPDPFANQTVSFPMVNSISHSSINTLPFMVMEKFVILISLAAICEESTPVTVRFKPALEMPLISVLPIACSNCISSFSSLLSLSSIFLPRSLRLSRRFLFRFGSSFLAFSSATC